MTYSQLYKITDTQLIITLPAFFKDKQVMVTVDDIVISKASPANEKMALMKVAAQDPLYLSDLKEVNDDFGSFEHETL